MAVIYRKQVIQQCLLIIKKPDLIEHSKWEVIFDKKIEVKIVDWQFLNLIQDGIIKISGGDRLVCDLEFEIEIDPEEYNVLNTEYIVSKVHCIKDKEEQLNLFS